MRVSILSGFAWMSALATGLSLDTPPKAAVRPVEDEYFGVKISDPYRWLENIKDSPEAQAWLRAQANYSRRLIDSMPGYEKLKARVTELINSSPATIAKPRQLANGNLFYLKTPANQNTAKLCFRKSASEDEIVLVDPDDFQKRTGLPYAINFFEPSWDGKYVAFGISPQGSENAEIRIIDIGMKNFKRDRTHAALLSGYGSYGIISEPGYQPTNLAFLEHGIWLAVAQVRGGGVCGDDWYRAGQKANKPNTWKDFVACGEYLINEKYAAKNKLAGIGGSAGGITIGRAVTDSPDLFAVAFPVVGLLDTLRTESSANGASNVPEYGTIKDEAGFRVLRQISTYDHIKDGTAYPAILLYHGYNDPRVDVWMSAKAGARFQAATTS
jgi:protease II